MKFGSTKNLNDFVKFNKIRKLCPDNNHFRHLSVVLLKDEPYMSLIL